MIFFDANNILISVEYFFLIPSPVEDPTKVDGMGHHVATKEKGKGRKKKSKRKRRTPPKNNP